MPTLDIPPKKRRFTVRKATAGAPAAKPARASSAGPATRRTRAGGKLPGWGELAPQHDPGPGGRQSPAYFEKVSTPKFALLLLAVAAAFTLYVGHVHATQDLLADVQQLRKDNVRLHMRYNRLKGEFDRRVGPAVIYQRAHGMGLEEDIRFGPTIIVE